MDRQTISNNYAFLMTEVRDRLEACQAMMNSTLVSPHFAREFCFLQYRMICELIAFACVVAHADVPSVFSNNNLGHSEADRLIKKLEHLAPDFYPMPVRFNGASIDVITTVGHLTKESLLRLYRFTGSVLHRGTIKGIAKEKPLQDRDFKEVVQWSDQIVRLLNTHIIYFNKGALFLGCQLKSKDGTVKCFFGVPD